MEKAIEIIPPKGYEVDKERSTFERIVFKEIKKELTCADIFHKLFDYKLNYYINSYGGIDNISNAEGPWSDNHSTTKEQLESILALNKLCNVAKYLNGDWLPDNNKKESSYVHIIDFDNNGKASVSFNYCRHTTIQYSCVYFKTKELAQQAIAILGEEEIRKALTLNH